MMTKNKVHPYKSSSNNSDDLYNLLVGVTCGGCICITICISILLLLHFMIERELPSDGSETGLIL
jgi:hypothetical protein